MRTFYDIQISCKKMQRFFLIPACVLLTSCNTTQIKTEISTKELTDALQGSLVKIRLVIETKLPGEPLVCQKFSNKVYISLAQIGIDILKRECLGDNKIAISKIQTLVSMANEENFGEIENTSIFAIRIQGNERSKLVLVPNRNKIGILREIFKDQKIELDGWRFSFVVSNHESVAYSFFLNNVYVQDKAYLAPSKFLLYPKSSTTIQLSDVSFDWAFEGNDIDVLEFQMNRNLNNP